MKYTLQSENSFQKLTYLMTFQCLVTINGKLSAQFHVGRSRLTEMVGLINVFFNFLPKQLIKFVLNHCYNNFNSLSLFSFIITSMEPFFVMTASGILTHHSLIHHLILQNFA